MVKPVRHTTINTEEEEENNNSVLKSARDIGFVLAVCLYP